MAEHAEETNEYLLKNLNLTALECDEMWSFVKKKRRRLSVMAQLGLKKATHGFTQP
jgi:hypothetical protein